MFNTRGYRFEMGAPADGGCMILQKVGEVYMNGRAVKFSVERFFVARISNVYFKSDQEQLRGDIAISILYSPRAIFLCLYQGENLLEIIYCTNATH